MRKQIGALALSEMGLAISAAGAGYVAEKDAAGLVVIFVSFTVLFAVIAAAAITEPDK